MQWMEPTQSYPMLYRLLAEAQVLQLPPSHHAMLSPSQLADTRVIWSLLIASLSLPLYYRGGDRLAFHGRSLARKSARVARTFEPF